MSFEAALGRWRGAERADISTFTKSLKPEWVEEALAATGTASLRKRRLPAEKVVWLVVGMCLFTDRSMTHVIEHLGLVLGKVLVPSAITQARATLTQKPIKWLFERLAQAWSAMHEKRWRGLSLTAAISASMTLTKTFGILESRRAALTLATPNSGSSPS